MTLDQIIAELLAYFKREYGYQLDSSKSLFSLERSMLQMLIDIGKRLMQSIFDATGDGNMGKRIKKGAATFTLKETRPKTIHGLFGAITYRRAYYLNDKPGSTERACIPLDEKLSIRKKHTPGCLYFLARFVNDVVYQKSLNNFHELFRAHGADFISLRKAEDMMYELGENLEAIRQKEITVLYDEDKPIVPDVRDEITDCVVVMADATKVRHMDGKRDEKAENNGKITRPYGFKDAKIGSVSALRYDAKRDEVHSVRTSYVGSIEHYSGFSKRLYTELHRRAPKHAEMRKVFLGDGAPWIWDMFGDFISPEENAHFVLDFYHASEHVSDLCKVLYGDGSKRYKERYHSWRTLVWDGKVESLIKTLTRVVIHIGGERKKKLKTEIEYFETNKDRMHYDEYRAMHIPIGSGTIESGCKNVVGGRLKGCGMTWSGRGADSMLQIRCSAESGRLFDDMELVVSSVDRGERPALAA